MTTTSTRPKTSPSVSPDVYLWILQARQKLAKDGFHASADLDHTARIAAYQQAAGALMAQQFDLIEWPFADSSYPLSIVQQPVYERLIAAAAYKREENLILDSFYHKLENTDDEEQVLKLINVNLHTINELAGAIHNLTKPWPVRPRSTFDLVGDSLQRNLTGLRDLVRQHINPRFELALLIYEPERVDQEPLLVTTHEDIPTAMATLQALLNRVGQIPQHDADGQPLTSIVENSIPDDNA